MVSPPENLLFDNEYSNVMPKAKNS